MSDPFWKIGGSEALLKLSIGEEASAESASSSSVYTMKRLEDHDSCTCPAWRMQKGKKVDQRSCKHLKASLGAAYDQARLLSVAARNGDEAEEEAPAKPSKKRKAASKTSADDDKPVKKPKGRADTRKDEGVGYEEPDEDDDFPAGKAPGVLLAEKLDITKEKLSPSPEGYWMSEKLDGVRVFWDGESKLLSRLGNEFHAPDWFKAKLPKGVHLDGELFVARNSFSETISIVKSHASQKWGSVIFKVFDIPSMGSKPFEDRMEKLHAMFPSAPAAQSAKEGKGAAKNTSGSTGEARESVIEVVEQIECKGKEHLLEYLKSVESMAGEGVMLRKPKSIYEGKRSKTLLKVKTFYDAEAEVVGYVDGKGKYKGMTGSLTVRMASGKEFAVGSGMNDEQRANPPEIGAIVHYRFQEVTKAGVPRFPTFVGEALDRTEAKDADIPEHRLPGSGKEEDA